MRTFNNIVVMPTQSLLGSPGAAAGSGAPGIFRGGPVWPHFRFRIRERHCRGRLPIPRDSRPLPGPAPERRIAAGIWCGPVTPHFGHMIADFGGRIARSVREGDGLPLVFSLGPEPDAAPPAFFHDILRHYRVAPEHVLYVREPILFERLGVVSQAERHPGRGPREAHLDLMDAVVAAHGPVTQDVNLLFVSRSRYPDGRLAAEAYLDHAFARAGAAVMHPETVDLASQLDLYRRARRIVFSEGSAVHALQLLGRIEADVMVLVRRSGTRLARQLLRPRARSLAYRDLTTHHVHGLMADGRAQLNRALSLIDEAALHAALRGFGIDLAPYWDGAVYRDWRDADLRRWIGYMRSWDLHPRNRETIEACLARAGLAIDVAAVWDAPRDLALTG